MKLSQEKIKQATRYAEIDYQVTKEHLENYENDNRKELRLQAQECKNCFYLKSGFSGQAFTKYTCQHCEKEEYHPNTHVPNYCKECAKEHECCVRCASSL